MVPTCLMLLSARFRYCKLGTNVKWSSRIWSILLLYKSMFDREFMDIWKAGKLLIPVLVITSFSRAGNLSKTVLSRWYKFSHEMIENILRLEYDCCGKELAFINKTFCFCIVRDEADALRPLQSSQSSEQSQPLWHLAGAADEYIQKRDIGIENIQLDPTWMSVNYRMKLLYIVPSLSR